MTHITDVERAAILDDFVTLCEKIRYFQLLEHEQDQCLAYICAEIASELANLQTHLVDYNAEASVNNYLISAFLNEEGL